MTRRLAFALVAAAAAFGIVSAVQAAIPDAQGVIHGCYKTDNGNLRVIDPSSSKKDMASCKNDEAGLNWNQTGPAGPAGAQGPVGPQGPPGPGTRTIAGRVRADGTIVAGSGFSVTHVGTGGYEITFPPGTFTGSPAVPAVTVLPESVATPFQYESGDNLVGIAFEFPSTGEFGDTGFSFVAVQP